MSGCDSRKKRRELNKEEIRRCLEIFGDIINKRHDSNRMPKIDQFHLTWGKNHESRYNRYKRWYQIVSRKGVRLANNKAINFEMKQLRKER
jgi:hypothetical protein